MIYDLRFKIWVFLFAALFSGSVQAQVLAARVNRDVVPVGETFVYVLDYTGDSNMEPDLSGLGKNFTVYSAYNSIYEQEVDGRKSRLKQWQVSLGALKKGVFEIAPVKLDNVASNAVQVSVVDAAAPSGEEDISPFINSIDVKADTFMPFVQQQVNLIITLTDARSVQMENIQIVDDGSNTWMVKELKKPEVRAVESGGKQAREFKYFFALFPQKSGYLKTPEFRLNGYYLTKFKGLNTHARPFGNIDLDEIIGRKNPLSLATTQIDMEVRPVRIKNQWWLPAKQVEMSSEFEPENPVFKVGEAVNREIKIAARGVLESQLPEIKFPKIEGMKQYPSKPASEQEVRGNDVVSIKSISNVYIPTKEGKMVLPEVEVNWFNVETAQQEVVSLPAIEINVEKGEVATSAEPAVNNAPAVETEPEKPAAIAAKEKENEYKIYVITAIAFVLGIVVAVLILRPKTNKINHKKEVGRALSKRDYKAARDHLIKWAREFYGAERIHNLADVGNASGSKDFSEQLKEMEKMLYSGKESGFNARAFMDAFEKANKKGTASRGDRDPLPGLYE